MTASPSKHGGTSSSQKRPLKKSESQMHCPVSSEQVPLFWQPPMAEEEREAWPNC